MKKAIAVGMDANPNVKANNPCGSPFKTTPIIARMSVKMFAITPLSACFHAIFSKQKHLYYKQNKNIIILLFLLIKYNIFIIYIKRRIQ